MPRFSLLRLLVAIGASGICLAYVQRIENTDPWPYVICSLLFAVSVGGIVLVVRLRNLPAILLVAFGAVYGCALDIYVMPRETGHMYPQLDHEIASIVFGAIIGGATGGLLARIPQLWRRTRHESEVSAASEESSWIGQADGDRVD